jgi:hypothetical protein
MMFIPLLVWIAFVGFGVINHVPDCQDRLNEEVAIDGTITGKVQIKLYETGISFYVDHQGYKYDYFFTVDPNQHEEALKYQYTNLGQCVMEGNKYHFSKKSVNITEGA